MVQLNIKIDDREIKKWLRGAPKKIRFAQKNALNLTAERIIKNERIAMQRVFDRPTRWILNGMFISKAGPNRLEAFVKFKDRGAASKVGNTTEEIIWSHIKGVPRKQKRGEAALAARGRMGSRRHYAPGSRLRLNRFGNITKGQINKMLSGVRGQRDTQQDTIRRRSKFFILKRNGKPVGIFERRGKTIKPMLMFIGEPHYRKRFDYFGIADRTIKKWYPIFVNKAIRDELRGVGRAR